MRKSLRIAVTIPGSIAFWEERASSQVLIKGGGSKGGRVHCPSGFATEEGQQFADLIGSLSKGRGRRLPSRNWAVKKI